ncbi:MAG: hypothetical protein NTY46_06605 [Candidatus Sumerlaeota bacterium]|nr:hypothetical protein [Candidatus Sumerlaeota bacterium]
MQYIKYGKAVAVVALLLSATLAANANIFIDENFEGQTVFTDLNYPIRDDTTSPTEANIAATQGINVRALDDAQAAPPVLSISNTGTVTSVMAYHGTKCLQLASGQSVSVPSLYTNAGMNWYQVMQFAISVNSATLQLPAGTRVGIYRQDWSTIGSTGPASVFYQLNFTRNAVGGIDIIVDNNSAKAGEITGAGNWAVITVVADKQINNPVNWECWDPLKLVYKGPQPTGDPIGGSGTYATLTDGIIVFVNSNSFANQINAATLGNNWANDNTYLLTWQLTATNNGTLFVDEFCYSTGKFQDGMATGAMNQDAAARMAAFNEPASAVDKWSLY